jgi:hypothetical protein
MGLHSGVVFFLFFVFHVPGDGRDPIKNERNSWVDRVDFFVFFFISRILAARMTGSHTADLCVRDDSRNDRKKKKMNQTDKKKLPERCEGEKGGGMAVCA